MKVFKNSFSINEFYSAKYIRITITFMKVRSEQYEFSNNPQKIIFKMIYLFHVVDKWCES